ncbi:MAG: TRAP transporter substrate-binding protein [Desulfomonilaceae bacterium]|nr:TRAP transporter substrate-binding protein [Desulfomonilaceae bacterium]
MNRREVIGTVGVGIAAVALASTGARAAEKPIRWKMSTSYPPKFPILQDGCDAMAKKIETMSQGRLKIDVYAAGELIGPFDVFDAVSQGKAIQAASTAAYYFPGKVPVASLFTACPFGFTPDEVNAWMYYGGGLDIYRDIFKAYNIYPIPHLTTGTQMGGWFRKEINSVDDIKGLKFRIPGLGGKVMAKLGATVVLTPGGEVFTALERGVIDACEWASPVQDLRLGLCQAAKYYYFPGWQEPTATPDLWVNLKAWEALPPDLKAIVEAACIESLTMSNAQGIVANSLALQELVEKRGVILKKFPDDVLVALREASKEVLEEEAKADPNTKRVLDSYTQFQDKIRHFRDVSEIAYYKAREPA